MVLKLNLYFGYTASQEGGQIGLFFYQWASFESQLQFLEKMKHLKSEDILGYFLPTNYLWFHLNKAFKTYFVVGI